MANSKCGRLAQLTQLIDDAHGNTVHVVVSRKLIFFETTCHAVWTISFQLRVYIINLRHD